jgi:hypothetical protein
VAIQSLAACANGKDALKAVMSSAILGFDFACRSRADNIAGPVMDTLPLVKYVQTATGHRRTVQGNY